MLSDTALLPRARASTEVFAENWNRPTNSLNSLISTIRDSRYIADMENERERLICMDQAIVVDATMTREICRAYLVVVKQRIGETFATRQTSDSS